MNWFIGYSLYMIVQGYNQIFLYIQFKHIFQASMIQRKLFSGLFVCSSRVSNTTVSTTFKWARKNNTTMKEMPDWYVGY